MSRPSDLPNFDNPPVVEVALSVRFEPLRKLTAPQMGRYWGALGSDFAREEEAAPLPPDLEHIDRQPGEHQVFLGFSTLPEPARVLDRKSVV